MKSIDVDLFQFFSLQFATLKLFGVWFYIPHSYKSVWFWLKILTRIFLGATVFIIPTGGQLIYVIQLFIQGNARIQEITGIINLILTELLVSIKLLDMFLHRHTLMQLTDQLMSKEFQFYLKPQQAILQKAISSFRKIFWVLTVSCSMDIIVHVIVVPGMSNFEMLPLKMDLIWLDLNRESYFNYVFAYQVLYKPTVLATYIALQTLPWAAMSCAISQLDVLIYNFENIKGLVKSTMTKKQCDSNTAFKEVFKECVFHYCCIIRFINRLQNTFGGQFSTTLALNGCIVGTTAVQIFSIDSPLKNITDVVWILAYLAIFICILFIECNFGNTITYKSLQISTLVFSCPWIELPTSMKKDLIIFIAETQQPVVITAANYVPVSLETFTKVMNWTYKGFAVMNQMKK